MKSIVTTPKEEVFRPVFYVNPGHAVDPENLVFLPFNSSI
jgi:hypothetical protein